MATTDEGAATSPLPPRAPMADAPAPTIPVGSRVKVKGLAGAAYLNGASGEVTGPPACEPEFDPPRYPVRLLAPRSAVAAHPQGVRVKEANLEVTALPDIPRLSKLQKAQASGTALSPGNAGRLAASFVQSLEADQFPEEALQGLFGVAMPAGGRDGTEVTDGGLELQRCRMGQLALGAWQELLQSLQAQRLGAAARAVGCKQQELDFAIMSASIGGLEALKAMFGKRGAQLAAVAEACRRGFMGEVERELRGGGLPAWFEAGVRRVAAARSSPAGSPYCIELCSRGFEKVPWDTAALARVQA